MRLKNQMWTFCADTQLLFLNKALKNMKKQTSLIPLSFTCIYSAIQKNLSAVLLQTQTNAFTFILLLMKTLNQRGYLLSAVQPITTAVR